MKKMMIVCLLAAASVTAQAQTEMKVVDSTTTFKPLTEPLERGTLIKTSTFHFYEINDKITQKSGWPKQPEIVVYQEGKKYKMKIQGIEKPLAVNKIQEVIESNIAGDFKGYDGTTSFKLQNGQDWKQDETTSNVFSNLFRPAVIIYLTSEGYKMKIEGLNESPILVKKK
ncbi:MAG: hypothetical protein V4539_06115 [Bacteroidota bacterium]